ncbi:hypothetical protein HYU07_05770 [Candidatus Woesearchaeota archaeon]|nr:hypothetical protein [Candidatus Woesearchaeota archaeon]
MGKTAVIKSLSKCIGNVALHKALLKHTNKPESIKHLRDEVKDYASDAFEKSQLYSWTAEEKEEIRNKAISRAKNIIKGYPDISFSEDEIREKVFDTMQEFLLM